MSIKNILTHCNQSQLKQIETNLEKQFSAIYRTYGVLAHKEYKVASEIVIKELKKGQFEFLNYADLLVKELRLSTIYDLSNLLAVDLLPNNSNKTIFIRGFGQALFYKRALHTLLGIDEDIVWSAYTSTHPMLLEILPTFFTDYAKRLQKEDTALIAFENAMNNSFDESIQFFSKRAKFAKLKSW